MHHKVVHYIDYVCGQAETGEKVATASSFMIVYEKSEGNSIERSIAKTFPEWNNSPYFKYVIYFCLVTYFVILCLSVWFFRISIYKIS